MKFENKKVKLAPSILSADFAHLGIQVSEASKAGADYIHVDVMDGHFVPNITMGPPLVASLRACTDLPLDVHLMIEHPEYYIPQFVDAGADIITVHVEACTHLHRIVQLIKEHGVKAGVSLNPSTPLVYLENILQQVNMILVMSVNPGFGGQIFIPETLGKLICLRSMLVDYNVNPEIEVDGGITVNNANEIVNAGGDILAIGSSIFKAEGGITQALQDFRTVIG